ncbi:hypothetical protein RBA71_13635 [Brenneria goodwinii]|uniref:hypothetical protein n=1 Tax=Brenneria goodwinii TaxID=1109412 RepID=UPI0036E2C6FF
MSKRSEVIEPCDWTSNRKTGLVYSNVLGWIDIGHAQGTDIISLLAEFRTGEAGKADYYQIDYTQKMHAFSKRFGTGKYVKWEIKKGRTVNEIHSIALGMMMMTARVFEGYQASPFFSWYTDSGFSGEDLTSDLLGFYRAILPSNYQSRLKLVSKYEALKRWDYYGPIGNYKNTGFLPLLFPDPEDPCVIRKPYKGNLPHFMRWIQPYTDLRSDNVRVLNQNGTYFSFLK